MTDDEADRILTALGREGFVLPYAVHSRDYLPDDPHLEGEARRDAIRRLKEADAEADRQNRDALRRALEVGSDTRITAAFNAAYTALTLYAQHAHPSVDLADLAGLAERIVNRLLELCRENGMSLMLWIEQDARKAARIADDMDDQTTITSAAEVAAIQAVARVLAGG